MVVSFDTQVKLTEKQKDALIKKAEAEKENDLKKRQLSVIRTHAETLIYNVETMVRQNFYWVDWPLEQQFEQLINKLATVLQNTEKSQEKDIQEAVKPLEELLRATVKKFTEQSKQQDSMVI